ncbi:MAG: hypothetical protein NZL99_04320, partial [Burkholderiaceae bacterium]|nr:hypothetical protein [Burkholderiaceae bacterium]
MPICRGRIRMAGGRFATRAIALARSPAQVDSSTSARSLRKLPREAGEPPFAEGERDDAIYLLGEG